MCCRYDAGRYWLEDVVVANAALLTRKLMRKYGIPIENVLRHYDVVSKRCPAMWVDDENAWFAFKRQVMEVMEMTKEELLSLKDTATIRPTGRGKRHSGPSRPVFLPATARATLAGSSRSRAKPWQSCCTNMIRCAALTAVRRTW